MEQHTSNPGLGKLIPPFSLRSIDDKTISPWDYKEKMGLMIIFFNIYDQADLEALAVINRRYHEITDENAEVIAISPASVEDIKACSADFNFAFPLLSDPMGKMACQYNANESMIYVADKFGELQFMARLSESIDDTLNNVINVLDLAELECPECGVSTWTQ
ncbi:MAG: redoxin domain-containing protein [Armatimonadota bacterium]